MFRVPGPPIPTAAGPPASMTIRSSPKPEPAARMVTRFLDAGHRAAWVAGDEVYGGNPRLRTAGGTRHRLRPRGGLLARSHHGRREVSRRHVGQEDAQESLAEAVRRGRSQEPPLLRPGRHDLTDPRPGSRQLLIRRNHSTGERASYRCYSPAAVPLTALVRVAGSRWRVEESGKGLAAWTSTRSAATRPGPAASPWPCSRMPSSLSFARTNTRVIPRPTSRYRSLVTRSNDCSSRSSTGPSLTLSTDFAGPSGDAATRPDPGPATSGGKPLMHEDHDLRL